jgi:hypothetical protein
MMEQVTTHPSPNLRQYPAHLVHIEKPTRQLTDDKVTSFHAECLYYLRRDGYLPEKALNSPYYPLAAPSIYRAAQNDGKQCEGKTAEECIHKFLLRYPQKTTKDVNAEFREDLKRAQDMLEKVVKDVKELKADMASRSVTVSSTPQLPIPPMVPAPPKVQSPPTLSWVPSLPAPAPILLVTPPLPLSPAVPPGLSKPTQSLPPITETTPPTPLKPKPDLGPVVHTIDPVTPEKAHPPHPPSLSTTGVVLFSLLLLHHQGSYHWLVIFQPEFLEPSGSRPDPEPPPGLDLVCRGCHTLTWG